MKVEISTDQAPSAIGPYSQAVVCQNMMYCSGQIPVDPATGSIVSQDIKDQTRQVLKNIEQLLKASGGQLNQVVKTTIFLQDMNHFPLVNEIYGEFFEKPFPARSTVQVSRLPLDVLIEIETIAWHR